MTVPKKKGKFRIKISILHKIISYAVSLVFATVGISTYIAVSTEREVLSNKLMHQGKRIAKDIAFSTRKALLSSDWSLVEKMLADFTGSDHSEVIYIWLVNPEGKIHIANDISLCGNSVDKGLLDRQDNTSKRFFPERKEYGMLLVNGTVIENRNWYVLVALSSHSINATTKRLIFHNLVSGTFAVLLGTVVSLLLAKSICKPIIGLKQAAATISDGNLDHRVVAESNDEVGDLANTFNDMALKLKKSRAGLEEKVEELATEKELLAITLGGMSEGLIAVDTKKHIILFNTTAEKLSGWKFAEVHGRLIDDIFRIVNEQTNEPLESPINRALQTGIAEFGTPDDALVSKDARLRAVAICSSPIRKKDGAIVGVVTVVRDVSREREIDHMKEDFTSSVSHELRTPLTSIKAYTETILRDPNMPEETRLQFLAVVDEESDRLATLIEDLLEVSRIQSGKAKFKQEPVDVTAIVEKVVTALQPLAEKNNIRLQKTVAENLPELQADAGKIESVVTNLLNNAIKFTPQAGRVSIHVQKTENEMVIRVSDTGMGIPKESLPKIFDRFYRVNRPGKQIQGTGLGLSIVSKIVTMHNGRIDVESDVDKGTTFTVFLPLKAAAAQQHTTTKVCAK